MALIISDLKNIDYRENLDKIIQHFHEEFLQLKWVISDLEFQCFDFEEKGPINDFEFDKDYFVICGNNLLELIKDRKLLFIWSVMSGVNEHHIDLDEDEIPYADCNGELWTNPDKLQLEQTQIEIVIWDGSDILLKFKDEKLENKCFNLIPESKKLEKTDNIS